VSIDLRCDIARAEIVAHPGSYVLMLSSVTPFGSTDARKKGSRQL